MAVEKAQKNIPDSSAHSVKSLASIAEKTVQNWPKWKRETYNNYYATASGSKKY